MEEMKKGADAATPTPNHMDIKKKAISQIHYSRANKLCLGILLICIIVCIYAYSKSNDSVMTFCFGGVLASGLILVALNPIEED